MKWKCAGVLLLLFFAQLTGGAAPARATSVYDTYIVPTDQLILHSDDTYYPCYNYQQDWSTSWTRWIYDPDFWSFGGYSSFQSDYIDAWEAAQTSGGWVITEAYGSLSDPSKGIMSYVVFSPSPLYLDWQLNSGVSVKASDSSALYSMPMQLFYYEGCSGAVWGPERPLSHPIGNSTPGGYIRLFAAGGSITPNYPAGYEGELLSVAGSISYVAMGDSFSSGEGNPTFEYGTDQGGTNENHCHRSPQSYPRLLQNDSSLNLGPAAFVACAGATTADVTNGKYGEDPQTDALSEETEVVTVTVGGNDIKFKEFAKACVLSNCNNTSSEYQESWDIMTDSGRSDYLPPKLGTVFAAIASGLTTANTSAQVYVVGYPKVITQASWTETTSSNPNNCLYMTEASASAAEAVIAKLNSTIEAAVDAYNDPRFTFVDPTATGSPFIGHELCRSGGYFNGLESAGIFGGNDAYVFHPNENGQLAYKELIADAMS